MKKRTEKFEITIKTGFIYKHADAAKKALEGLEKEELLPVPILFSIQNLGKVEFYMEEVVRENCIGYLEEGNTFSKDDFEDLQERMQHGTSATLRLKSLEGSIFTAVLEIKEPVVEEVVQGASMDDAIERVVSEGIMTKSQAERNLAVMRAHGVSDILIAKVFSRCKKYNKPAHVPSTLFVDSYQNKQEAEYRIIANTIRCFETGAAVIYEGDRSVGKNVCCETIAMLLNMPYYLITFSKRMTSEDIYGAKTTDNTAASMLTEEGAEAYMASMRGDSLPEEKLKKAIEFQLMKAKAASINIVQESSSFVEWLLHGGLLVLNEMNLSDPNFFASIFNQLLDGTKFIYVPGYGRVDVNPDCLIIGTQNKASYAGVNQQNNATMSRFGCLDFPFPDTIRKQLKEAVSKRFKVDIEVFRQVDNLYRQLKKAVDQQTVSNECLNIRGFIRAIEAYAIDPSSTKLGAQIKIHVVNTCQEDQRDIINAQVTSMITL